MKHRMPGYAGSWGYPAPADIEVGDRVDLRDSHSSDPRPIAVRDENGSHVVVQVHHLHGGGECSHWSDPEVTVSAIPYKGGET